MGGRFRRFAHLFLLSLALGAPSQVVPATDNCDLTAWVWDRDTTGTNIRDAPKGAIIDKIYPDTAETGFRIRVLGSNGNWIRCEYTAIDNQTKRGWIHGGMVNLDTRNYGDQQAFHLYASHDTKSKILKKVVRERNVQVYGCHKDWAYIKVMIEGKAYYG